MRYIIKWLFVVVCNLNRIIFDGNHLPIFGTLFIAAGNFHFVGKRAILAPHNFIDVIRPSTWHAGHFILITSAFDLFRRLIVGLYLLHHFFLLLLHFFLLLYPLFNGT